MRLGKILDHLINLTISWPTPGGSVTNDYPVEESLVGKKWPGRP
jgi:hypothetical protein